MINDWVDSKLSFITKSIQLKILVPMLILSLVPIFVLGLIIIDNTSKDLQQDKFVELQNALDLKHEKIDLIFQGVERDAQLIHSETFIHAQHTSFSNIEHTEIIPHETANFIKTVIESDPAVNEFIITDQHGNIIYEFEEKHVENTVEPLSFYLDKYLQTDLNDIYYSDVFFDSNNHLEMFLFSPYTINDFSGVMIMEINLDYVYSQVIDHTGLGESGEILLGQKTGENAIFINPLKYDENAALSHSVRLDEQRALPIRQAVQGVSGCGQTTDYRNEPIFACWGNSEKLGWGIVAKIDQNEVFEALEYPLLFSMMTIILTAIFITIFSNLIALGIQRPIAKLNKIFGEFNTGKFTDTLTVKGNDEVSELSKSFLEFQETFVTNEKIKKYYQKELESKLEESANFKKALDESTYVSITDVEGNIVYVNEKFLEITKYSASELIGQNHRILKSDLHPPTFYKKMWKTISSGQVWKGDIKNKDKNGDFFWTKTTIIPFLGKDGKPVHYIAVRANITPQKEYEEKLTFALQEIKKTDVLKNEFASMITHELKTPLTPIRGYCEMLQDKSLGDLTNEQMECINTIDSNAVHLEELIGDILDVQKLDMGQLTFNKKHIHVGEFLSDLTKSMIPIMSQKQIQFSVPPVEEYFVVADEQRLKQIFSNLIRNAADFVPIRGGKIKVGTISEKNDLTFYVEDNGIGIPESKQKNIFKKFYQIDTTQTRKHGGTGLGLVVCKGLVEGMGGKIWVESKEGAGTIFYFTIPRKLSVNMEITET